MADETLLTIPDATRRVLECRHMKFDTGVIVSGARPFIVMVFHAAYGIGAIRRPPVIKFTESRHAIAHSENIKLATPQYYRRMEHPDGIADPMETRFVENYDAAEYFDKSGIKRPAGLAAGMGSVTLTKGANNFWMYCGSMAPGTPGNSTRCNGRIFLNTTASRPFRIRQSSRHGWGSMWGGPNTTSN